MATLIKVWQRTKAQDQSQTRKDAGGNTPTVKTAQEIWGVLYDGVVDAATAETAAGLPTVGSIKNGLYCTGTQAIRRSNESPYAWDVRVDYANVQAQGGTLTTYNVSISKSVSTSTETAEQDRLGLPLVNTVNDLLPRQPTRTLYDEVFTITYTTKVLPSFANVIGLDGKTNSSPFGFNILGVHRSFEKSQVKIETQFSVTKITNGVSGASQTVTPIYDCQITLMCRYPKWVWRAPNEGFYGFDDNENYGLYASDHKSIINAAAVAAGQIGSTTPFALDLDGHLLEEGQSILMLPDAAIGQNIPNSRNYDEDGAFELDDQADFSPFMVGLSDTEQGIVLVPG